jgi:putative nucleotidyltransferase with HDIG domain
MKYWHLISIFAAMIIPYALFEYLRGSSMDLVFAIPRGHFYMVSLVALLSLVIAITVGIAGTRLRNIQVIILSLAFISLAGVFAIHGLSTPNFLIHATHVPSVAAPLSVILASIWLWFSSLPSDHSWIQFLSRYKKTIIPIWSVLLGLVGTILMSFPNLVDFIPLNINPFNWTFAGIVIILNVSTMYRYYRSFLYSRFPLQLAIVYSCGWLILSQIMMIIGDVWMLSWWLYHFLLLASMLVMLVGLYRQYAAKQSLSGAMRALFTTDPIERITNCLSPSIKALMVATEKKDTYTAGHSFRVTMYALKLAEEMKVRPEQLRALAQGTIVHDVGKIEIPDAILNKPGKLTVEERSIIEEHPVQGYDMCRDLGFMQEELSIIRSHHEKWNGQGYPDRLRGEQIPLLSRIVAVADVYDALTSDRSYRKALSHSEAMIFLEEFKGTHFDPQCVEAWERVNEGDQSIKVTNFSAVLPI